MFRRQSRLAAALATAVLVVAACGDDDDDNGGTEPAGTEAPGDTGAADDTEATTDTGDTADTTATDDTEATEGTGDDGEDGAAAGGWTVGTEDCIDPDAANAPIGETVVIGSAMPLSGGPAAAAYAPVALGLQAYFDYANENELIPGHTLELTIADDQYDAALTPGAVSTALDDGAQAFVGILGTPNNEAVRDTLNEECVPQMLALTGSPAWGDDVVEYPWTTGGQMTYTLESKAYAADIAREFPDGATVAIFTVNNDFGAVYRDVFDEIAGDFNLEIVDSQTIEAPDTTPPAPQLNSMAETEPDVIMAAPIGAQCPTFLNELANQRAARPSWEPRVYLTASCASPLILEVAGDSADGLFTTQNMSLVDLTNPENEAIIAEYKDYIDANGLAETFPTSAAGWTVGEAAVEIIRNAADSPDGLTRASIINAARNLQFTPSMGAPGSEWKMSGEEDGFYVEDVQIRQYNAGTGVFTDIGELITEFRSS